MFKRLFTGLARLWWPRRLAAVLAVLLVAWSLLWSSAASPQTASWWMLGAAALQLVAAIGLWVRWRWAWAATLVLQAAPPLLGLFDSFRAMGEAGWWLQQGPHLIILVLLLLPQGHRSRAALREPGFEPGDTMAE